MTVIDMSMRNAIAEALQLLERPDDTRIAQARAVLQQALAVPGSRGLTDEQHADLAGDPTVQAALDRIQARRETYYTSAPGGGPSNTPFVPASPMRPVKDSDLEALGF